MAGLDIGYLVPTAISPYWLSTISEGSSHRHSGRRNWGWTRSGPATARKGWTARMT